MAHTLIENVNGNYYRNLSILTGKPNQVKVIVEDEVDVSFWYDVLTYVRPDKVFSIVPYSYVSPKDNNITLEKGKAHILAKARANELNAYYIGCVDSDYDYLLEDYSEDGKLMASNPYLLQTYAYSIENLLCHAETLTLLCSKSVKEVPDFDFQAYMANVSRIIRPLFIRALYCTVKNYPDFTATDWRNIFPCNEHIGQDSESPKRILERLQQKVDETILWIDTNHPEMTEEIPVFECELFFCKGILEICWIHENCYFAVRGHDLYRFVFNTTLKGITEKLKSKHLTEINNAVATDKEKANNRQHYLNEIISIENLLKTNYEYKHKNCPLFDMIKCDIEKIWAGA